MPRIMNVSTEQIGASVLSFGKGRDQTELEEDTGRQMA